MDNKPESLSFQVTINTIEDRVLFDALRPLSGRRRAGMARSLMRQGIRPSNFAAGGSASAGSASESANRQTETSSAALIASPLTEDYDIPFDVHALMENLSKSMPSE